MTHNITLTFGGVTYGVLCQGVLIGWTNNTVSKPNANGTSVSEIQTQSFENPLYTLRNVELLESSSLYGSAMLTYPVLISMLKNKYDGTNGILLSVNYGASSSKKLVRSDGVTEDIPVVIKSFSPTIGLDKTYDGSATTYNMTGFNLVLQETA